MLRTVKDVLTKIRIINIPTPHFFSGAVSRKFSNGVTKTYLKALLLAWLVHIYVEVTNSRLSRLELKLGCRNPSVVSHHSVYFLPF